MDMNKIVTVCQPFKNKYDICFKENLQVQWETLCKQGPSIEMLFGNSSAPHPCEELFDDYKTCMEVAMKLAIQKNKESK